MYVWCLSEYNETNSITHLNKAFSPYLNAAIFLSNIDYLKLELGVAYRRAITHHYMPLNRCMPNPSPCFRSYFTKTQLRLSNFPPQKPAVASSHLRSKLLAQCSGFFKKEYLPASPGSSPQASLNESITSLQSFPQTVPAACFALPIALHFKNLYSSLYCTLSMNYLLILQPEAPHPFMELPSSVTVSATYCLVWQLVELLSNHHCITIG